MADEDKPFACNHPGCTQRFSNADHLEVHENKHRITVGLQLPGKDQLFGGVDQTPTPTRFLAHGDQYGLFDALKEEVKQPNPFDQAFMKKSTSSSGTAVTPVQSFPVTNPVKNAISQLNTSESDPPEDSAATTTTLSVLETSTDLVGVSSSASSPRRIESSPPTQSSVFVPVAPPRTMANPSIAVPVAPGPAHLQGTGLGKSVGLTTATTGANGNIIDVKQQLKKNIVSQNPNLLERAMAESKIGSTIPTQVVPESQRGASTIKKRARTRSEDVDPDEKRRRFLERNRAAATRCREKRKTWINGLEKKAQEAAAQNQHLTQEIAFLRNEVAQLKSLLLAHKDCPVTLQQQRLRMQLQNNAAAVAAVSGTATTTPPTSSQSQTLFLLANNLSQQPTSVGGTSLLISGTDQTAAVPTSTISLQALATLTKSGQNFVLQSQQQQSPQPQKQ